MQQQKQVPVSIVIFIKDIFEDGFKIWMQKRVEDGPLNGLLEFPGGKIEAGESSEQAARREILEEVSYTIPADSKLPLFKLHPYDYKDRSIQLFVHISNCSDVKEEVGQWFDLDYKKKSSVYEGSIPAVNHLVIDELCDYLSDQISGNTVKFIWN